MEALFMQAFERRDWVEGQMRQQVASFSEYVACTLLAAGSRPPPWLLPHSAAATRTRQGNTLRKPSLDLANLERADGVHLALPKIHQLSEPETAEFDGVKPGSGNSTGCSEVDKECKNCDSDTTLTELAPVDPLNEDPSSTNSLEAPTSVASPLLENDSLQSVKPNFLEGIVSVPEPLPEKDAVQVHTTETDYPEGPHSTASLLLEKEAICSNEVNFLDGPPSICLLLAKEPEHTSELDSPEELHENAISHDVRTSSLEGPHPMASLSCEKETVHTSEASFLEGPQCVASPLLESEQLYTVEHTEQLKNSYLNRSIDRCPTSHEQESSEFILPPSCYVSSSRPAAQLADTTSGDQERLGMLQNNMLDDGYGCSPHPKENAMEDGGGHYSHSELDGALSTCSLQKSGDDNVYQNKVVSSGTISDNDSNSANALDALISPQNELCQMQSSVHKLSSRYCRTGTVADTCIVFSPLSTSNKRPGREPAIDSTNCHLKQSGPAEGKLFVQSEECDNMDKSVTPVVAQEVHLSANSSPGRCSASPSDVICSNSRSMKASLCIGSTPSSNLSLVPQSDSLENNLDAAISCFKYPDADVRIATVQDKVVTEIDYLAYESGVLKPENYPITTSPTTFTSCALFQQNQQARASNESVLEKLNYDSNLVIDEKDIDEGLQVSDGAIPRENDDNYVDYDETMQSFSITVPSKARSPTIKERAFAGLCDSTKLINLSTSLSAKYKMDNKMSGHYQALSARFKKLIDPSSINSVDTKWHDPSYDVNKLGVSGKYSLELDGSFRMSNVLSFDTANSISVQEDCEIPLTPSVEKYSLEKLSGRTRSNSGCMGSIPGLACFKIDEASSMAEENENREILPRCPGRNYSSQGLTGRKPLEHVSSFYQSRENSASLSTRYVDVGRLGLTTTKVYTRNPDYHLHLSINEAIKNPKENCAPSIKKGKAPHPLYDRASRTGLLSSKNIRHRSEENLEKGWKPSNIINNMKSFVPLVKQQQKSTMTCVKKDVRVKALEAAEAAKRRQQKKQNERHMRKAAAELERVRLKQEREQRQKQKEVEQKKKIDADDVTRKRLREDDEKKEKERKKKRAEEAWKPEQRMEWIHAANGEKDDCWKSSDDNEPRNDCVGVKHESIPDGRTESVYNFIASENHNLKSVVADGRSESSILQVQESFSGDIDESYEMSPYKDSDEEDDDDPDQEEVRRRKFIPSWSQDENLDKILLSNLPLDPAEIFARKCSFKLSDVLAHHIPQRQFS
ncbi:uncharacterized protein LOC100828113 isoform X2 [Brachypodium distachyon]|uniref:uncharacterized protein LOC100828113 isoform X2 n=1 Tax=Brachypodium distachyon TaxID=15368 RepID=UPI000D0DF436|nr:uncharacterized protein LOC100828113 isoform X2 [Brachypodium distachyon]|eukprot:XP_024318320.1 uncharacterized protein LOC100828113 isoform X2 [Brachypodium distachyon]